MKLRRSILNFLLVRESESKLVKNLFIFEFFQGSAIALFFTAAISLFLLHLPTSDMPKVYVLSAILLWVTGFLYHKLEHALSNKKLIISVIIFNTCLILLFRMLSIYNIEAWYLYLILACFNVLYLLNNLEFWGLAAQIFDVRQSKRLFGIISAGDIPAKMIGFLSAYLIVPFIGTENLLLVAAILSSISLLFLTNLFKITNIEKASTKQRTHHATHSLKTIHNAITENKLIAKIATVSCFSLAIFLLVNFIFYGYVKKEFTSDKDLVSFFAVFFGVTRMLTLIIKIGISNKMVDRMGLRNALLVSPIILFIICVCIVYFDKQPNLHKYTFYIFGILTVFTDVLRSAIQKPVLLATMQPLPVHQRLKGHTIIKGLMDPFAFLVVGIFLLVFIKSTIFDFAVLNYIIIVLVLLWAFFIWSIEKDYLSTLHTAIKNRTLNERDVSITDKESLDYLLEKLVNGNETEAISVLKIIANQPVDKIDFFVAGLNHQIKHVQLVALSIIQHNSEVEMLPTLKQFLNEADKESILPELITTISSLDKEFDLSDFILHHNANVSYAATLSTLPNLEKTNRDKAEQILFDQFNSKENIYKINALKIVAKLKMKIFDYKVIELMNSSNKHIKYAAINASAELSTKEVVLKLIDDYSFTKNDLDILEALETIGDEVIKYIQPILVENNCQGTKSRKLISLLGKINTEQSKIFLDQLLLHYPENADATINSLYQVDFKSDLNKEEINKIIKHNLDIAVQILFKMKQANSINPVISSALELELKIIRNKCLYWFSTLYNLNTINKVKIGFYLNTRESIANALELVQITVRKDFADLFALVYENSPISDKCSQLELSYRFNHLSDTVLAKNILFDVNYSYTNWTKACVLYGVKDQSHILNKEFIKPFTQSKSEVLKNTAEFILSIQK